MSDDTTLGGLVDGIPIAMVTADGPAGLCGRPLAVQRVDDDGTVWFLVDRDADWVVADLGRVNLAFVDTTTWVSAAGRASTVDDPAVLQDLGDPVTDTWFADGVDPVALRVVVEHADWWDAPGRLRQVVELIGARVTGHTPDMGDRGVVEP